jgi:hypothetical protein
MVEQWTGLILDIDEPSNATAGYHGGNEINRFNKLFDGQNLTALENADVTINTDWYFYNNKLKFSDGAGHTITIEIPTITNNKTLILPASSGQISLSTLGVQPVNWGVNLQEFVSGFLKVKDADQSHGITIKTSGLTSNFDLLFPTPGHATDEEVIYSKKANQTLYDKILSNPTFASFTFNVDSNILKHSITNFNSDLLVYKTSLGKYDRLGRGSAGQVLTVDPTGTFILWSTPAAGGGSAPSTETLLGNFKEGGYLYGWQYPFNVKGYGLLDQTASDITEQNVASFYDSATKRGHGRTITGLDGGTEGWARFGFVSFMFQRQFSPFVDFWMRLRVPQLDGRGYMFFFDDSTPNTTSDIPLDGQHGFGLIKRSTDTGWRKISCDGTATQEVAGTDLFNDDQTLRHLRIGFDEANSKMYIQVDGTQTDFTYATNLEPSATRPLFFYLLMDESGGTVDQIMEYYRFYCGMKIPA